MFGSKSELAGFRRKKVKVFTSHEEWYLLCRTVRVFKDREEYDYVITAHGLAKACYDNGLSPRQERDLLTFIYQTSEGWVDWLLERQFDPAEITDSVVAIADGLWRQWRAEDAEWCRKMMAKFNAHR